MVARFVGPSFGLLAFTIVTVAGLISHNPVEVTLSRGVFALFTFCIVGFLLGSVAQKVLAEHEQARASAIKRHYHPDPAGQDGEEKADTSQDTERTSSGS